MATIHIAKALPKLPEGWSSESGFIVHGSLSPPVHRSLEPVGPHFLAHARRKRHSRTFSEDDRIQAQQNVKKVEEDDSDEISEPEDPVMLTRDPKDWKNQDHYAVLGLSKYRWRATDEQIRKAHRKKVLKHHPDKKASAGQSDDDSFFKCIQKAMEILSDPVKRRQYDSVDEGANREPPSKKARGNFYKLWGPVFESEARFSRIQPVPKLGDVKSTKEEVDEFYNFWYNFDSWRSFEYLDEDVPDDNENRDQKRYVERKNKAQRAKKKTEDTARLRKLVDDCLALDERIKKFREAERAQKNAKRIAREAEEKRAAEEAKKKAEEEKKRKEEEEAAAKVEVLNAKKAKEAAKNAVKKNRRVLKAAVKDANYFEEGSPSPVTIDKVLGDVEVIQGKVDPDELNTLARKLEAAGKDVAAIKAVYGEQISALIAKGSVKAENFKILTPA
ncbi:DnaJ domain-containing protein [Kalaharituber pfeilii]|nr:DnaJ domain-containing protein [Kalaharituber pfeilii]